MKKNTSRGSNNKGGNVCTLLRSTITEPMVEIEMSVHSPERDNSPERKTKQRKERAPPFHDMCRALQSVQLQTLFTPFDKGMKRIHIDAYMYMRMIRNRNYCASRKEREPPGDFYTRFLLNLHTHGRVTWIHKFPSH